MSAEKRSVSAPANLFAQADQRKADLGYSTFSDYIQALIWADVKSSSGHLRETASTVPPPAQIFTSTHYFKKKKPSSRSELKGKEKP